MLRLTRVHPLATAGYGDQCVGWVDVLSLTLEEFVDSQISGGFPLGNHSDTGVVIDAQLRERSGVADLACRIRRSGNTGLDLRDRQDAQVPVGAWGGMQPGQHTRIGLNSGGDLSDDVGVEQLDHSAFPGAS
jgi:hypothetical protein